MLPASWKTRSRESWDRSTPWGTYFLPLSPPSRLFQNFHKLGTNTGAMCVWGGEGIFNPVVARETVREFLQEGFSSKISIWVSVKSESRSVTPLWGCELHSTCWEPEQKEKENAEFTACFSSSPSFSSPPPPLPSSALGQLSTWFLAASLHQHLRFFSL